MSFSLIYNANIIRMIINYFRLKQYIYSIIINHSCRQFPPHYRRRHPSPFLKINRFCSIGKLSIYWFLIILFLKESFTLFHCKYNKIFYNTSYIFFRNVHFCSYFHRNFQTTLNKWKSSTSLTCIMNALVPCMIRK